MPGVRFGSLVLVFATALSGCKSPPQSPLPQYALTDPQQTLAAYLAHRVQPKSVQAQATIELTDAKRQTVQLDAALLLSAPDRVRLRAWKFGTAVFDLTVQGQRAWAFIPRDEARPAVAPARKSIVQWFALLEGDLAAPNSRLSQSADALTIETPSDDGALRSTIDRRTLTVVRYEYVDSANKVRFTLQLADYHAQPDGSPWPMSIVAKSDQGIVAIRFSDVTLNEALPPDLLNPPSRAVVLP